MTQNEHMLKLLKAGPLTAFDAMQHGCFRLAARVKDLREQGHDIHTELCVTTDGKRFARYTLRKQSKAA